MGSLRKKCTASRPGSWQTALMSQKSLEDDFAPVDAQDCSEATMRGAGRVILGLPHPARTIGTTVSSAFFPSIASANSRSHNSIALTCSGHRDDR